MEKEALKFDDWLKLNEGQYEDEIILTLMNDPHWSGERILEEMAEYEDEFLEFCEENNFEPSWEPVLTLPEVDMFFKKYKLENPGIFE